MTAKQREALKMLAHAYLEVAFAFDWESELGISLDEKELLPQKSLDEAGRELIHLIEN